MNIGRRDNRSLKLAPGGFGPSGEQNGEHAQDHRGGYEKLPGDSHGYFASGADRSGVRYRPERSCGDQRGRSAKLRGVGAGDQFNGGAYPLFEFGMMLFDQACDSRVSEAPCQRSNEQPIRHAQRQAQRREHHDPPRSGCEGYDPAVDAHDYQQRCNRNRQNRRRPAQRHNQPRPPDQVVQGVGNVAGNRFSANRLGHVQLLCSSVRRSLRRSILYRSIRRIGNVIIRSGPPASALTTLRPPASAGR